MTFSPLTARSVAHHGKYSSRFGTRVSYLIVHHWAGTSGGDARLVNPSQEVSASYILYGSGELVGQVPEEYRPWTSGSPAADNAAITVETQNSGGAPDWPVSAAAVEKLAQLAADLCRRYGWGKLDRSRVRGHREFASTACPGPHLWARLDTIIARANQLLGEPAAPIRKDSKMHAVRQIGIPDSGVIIGGGQPPRARTNSVFVAECAALGITPVDCPAWQYETVVREAWADFSAATRYIADAVAGKIPAEGGTPLGLSKADREAIAKAVADEQAKRLQS